MSPARWVAARSPAQAAGARLFATGPVPGPYLDPTDPSWTLGDWFAVPTPFAPDFEEVHS